MPSESDRLMQELSRLMQVQDARDGLTMREIIARSGCNETAVRRIIKQRIEEGKIEVVRVRRDSACYTAKTVFGYRMKSKRASSPARQEKRFGLPRQSGSRSRPSARS